MNELQMTYIWQRRQLPTSLKITSGEIIHVIFPGFLNGHAGADFQHARIRINELEWIGAVELHVKSSDWLLHQHAQDNSYENVILHVVWENDVPISYPDGKLIPTLCLSQYIPANSGHPRIVEKGELVCQAGFLAVDPVIKSKMLRRMLFERVNQKCEEIHKLLRENKFDWEEAFYLSLAKSFGFSLNAEPMFRLAKNLPLKIILRYRDRPLGIEAALFGMAGLLEEPLADCYMMELRREYVHLKKKHAWEDCLLKKSDWKMLRLRPANFPQIRLAQFAEIIRANCALLSLLLEMQELKTLRQLFEIPLDPYWGKHTRLGAQAFRSICINTLIPMLVCYSRERKQEAYEQKAFRWLAELPAENNQITRIYQELGLDLLNAGESQACLHWHRHYCQTKQCLHCLVGKAILTPT
jgi:Protein of unknown function (DUF2851)